MDSVITLAPGVSLPTPERTNDVVSDNDKSVNNSSNLESEMKAEQIAPILIATTISPSVISNAEQSASNYGYATNPIPAQSYTQSYTQNVTPSLTPSLTPNSDWFYFLDNNGTS